MNDEYDARYTAAKLSRTADSNSKVTDSDAGKWLAVDYSAGRRTLRNK